MNPDPPQASKDAEKKYDIAAFANSMMSAGYSMKDRLSEMYQTFMSKIESKTTSESKQNQPSLGQIVSATTKYFSDKIPRFNVRQHLSSLVDYIVPDFSPDTHLFDSGTADDFFGAYRGGEKFLGKYTIEDATDLIGKSKIAPRLQELGIDDWYVEFDLSDCFSHYGYLRSKRFPDASDYIGFLIVQMGDFKMKPYTPDEDIMVDFVRSRLPEKLNVLNIRWFSLQLPKQPFPANRPRLPGQRYPGTGLARASFELFSKLAIKAGRDGIINVPEHFHNAYLYSGFYFISPRDQGLFSRISSDLEDDIKNRGLAAVSWAIYLGFLRQNGKPHAWEQHEQVFPLSLKMNYYFQSSDYKSAVGIAFNQCGPFEIVWEEAEHFCLNSILEFSENETSIPFPREDASS